MDVSINDVYEIAAEVCQEQLSTFLTNLVKLLPTAEETLDALEEKHFEERKSKRMVETKPRTVADTISIPPEVEEEEEEEDEFYKIAHPDEDKEAKAFLDDDFLNQLPTENAGLPGAEKGI